jgi:myosin-15
MVEEDDYQTLEDIKTTLLPPHSKTHFAYFNRVPWRLRVRKEVFSPSETVQSPLGINLIFTQV